MESAFREVSLSGSSARRGEGGREEGRGRGKQVREGRRRVQACHWFLTVPGNHYEDR